jgi:hypothetical protein
VELRAGVYDGSSYEQLRLWGDDVLLRVVDAGADGYPDPVALLEVAVRHGLRLA